MIHTVGITVSQALSQNAELRTRLSRIHSESVLSDQVVSVNIIPSPDEVRTSTGTFFLFNPDTDDLWQLNLDDVMLFFFLQ